MRSIREVLVALVAGGLLWGCVPAPLFESEGGGEENHPLWLDESTIYPDPREEVLVDRSLGGIQEFSVGIVVDDDLDDTIYLRWFIDYDKVPWIRLEHRLPPFGERERRAIPWTMDICDNFFDLKTKDRAIVEVVVSDREFVSGSGEDIQNRTVPEDAFTRTVFWKLRLEGDCP